MKFLSQHKSCSETQFLNVLNSPILILKKGDQIHWDREDDGAVLLC